MLEDYEFKSIFKKELKSFIYFKKSLGIDYKEGMRLIKNADKILYELNLNKKIITKEIFDALTVRGKKGNSAYAYLCTVIRHFCIFLTNNNFKNIYYEYKKIRIVNNYIPIMFNENEMNILFITLDNYKNEHKQYYNLYYTYSIMIRLIYSCGIRISEAINIKIKDINFTENYILIVNSKNHVSRNVAISDSMKTCLINYINNFPHSQELLFVNTKYHKIQKVSLESYYKKILIKSNLNCNAHIHDLRHVFANKALNQMIKKGYREYVALVYLCIYLGHKNINETIYYLHFTDYDRDIILNYMKHFSNNLYKEVVINE